MEDYKVYVHICPNGKRYYGSTKLDIDRRWRNGYGYKTQKYFWEDINKYGWNNIEHIIVAKGLTKEEAKWLEIELMRVWDTTNPDKGYNRIFGDATTKGKINSEDTKKKMSRQPSKDTRKRISEANKGKNNPVAKSVICLTTKRIFYTIKEGATCYEISRSSNIISCCKGKRKSAGKYQGKKLVWRYLVWNHNKKFRKAVSNNG